MYCTTIDVSYRVPGICLWYT